MKKLSSLFVLLCASVMAFAVGTDKVTMKGFNGLSGNSYSNTTVSGKSEKGIAMVAYAFNASNGQIRGNKTAIAGAEISTDDANKNFSLYNAGAMPGAIRSITLTVTGGTFQNNMYAAMGTISQGDVTSVTDAVSGTKSADSKSFTWIFADNTDYTFFKLLSNARFTSGTCTGAEITIEYADGGSTTDPVAVTGVTLDQETASVEVGKTITLVATVTPENATNKNITWATSNADVATVADGVVTAVAAGEATITVTTEDGAKTCVCVVTVTEASGETDYRTIHTSNVELNISTEGSKSTYNGTVNGNKAIKAGTTSATGTAAIMVPAYTTKLYFHAAAWNGKKTTKLQLTGATATPAEFALIDDSKVSGSGPTYDIADADHEAFFFTTELTGITAPTTLLFTPSGDTRFIIWGVNAEQTLPEPIPATGITLSETALSIENYKNTVALTATLTPENTTDVVEWSIADETVATINSLTGVITALKEGTTTITAKAGDQTATCALTITAPTALTCAQAVEIAKTVTQNNQIAAGGKYVIRGYMTEEAGNGFTSDLKQYNNISFWMSDERGGANVFEAYQVLPLDKENLPEIGDLVEVVGDITKYNTTYETVGKGSATMTVIEKAPLQYELNGGAVTAPATNLELWEMFKPDYNKYYNLQRADQPIENVTTFAPNYMQDFMTNEASAWKWLGDYVLSVVKEANFNNGALTSEVLWRFNVAAFFNCKTAASTWNGNPDFTEAGKPENWLKAWNAVNGLPEHVTGTYTLPVPTREGYVFAGWYNNAEFTGEAITTIDATTKGTLYAKWLVPATDIEMSEIGLNMTVGETFTLTVTVTPEDASLEGLTWTSSDETLATVKDGVVTAVAPTPDYEYVTITATLGELTATCDVAIYAVLESIKFNTTEMDTEFEYEEGLEISLTFDIQPANASTDGIIVTSSNTAVATITEQSFFGMTFFSMNVVGVGTTTLKVTTADGRLSDELVITVTPPAVHAETITVDKEALTLNVGDTYQLVATMTPEDAVDVIEWNSSKSGVATVENGLVTAVGVGEATIWITAGWNASATCKVTVNDKGTGLENIAELDTNAPIYNVLGQEVSAEYKGVVIQNGKKFLLQ